MKWEELNTPEAVLAAFEAGRRVEFTAMQSDSIDMPPHDKQGSGGWIIPRAFGVTDPKKMMTECGGRYRALIEDPAIPAGYTPWGGGECPEDARNAKTYYVMRFGPARNPAKRGRSLRWTHDGDECDIIAYRVEQAQPSQKGEAVDERVEKALAYLRPHLESGTFSAPDWAIQLASILTGGDGCGRPIPVESLGRDAEGVEGLASDDVVIERHWLENIASAACLLEGSGSIIDRREGEALRKLIKSALRLRPQVAMDDATQLRVGLALYLRDGGTVENWHSAYSASLRAVYCEEASAALTAALTEADSHGK